jgi:hypothetical protein
MIITEYAIDQPIPLSLTRKSAKLLTRIDDGSDWQPDSYSLMRTLLLIAVTTRPPDA